MQVWRFPALCWDLSDGQTYGELLGTNCTLYAATKKKLKTGFTDWLAHHAQWYGYALEPELDSVKLRIDSVDVRPAYPGAKGKHVVKYPIRLLVASVYGDNAAEGHSLCYLPHLKQEFYYYEEKQLDTLIQHFTHDFLDGMTPEQIHPYIMPSTPWLETIRYRSREKRQRRSDPAWNAAIEALSSIAERLPVKHQGGRPRLVREQAWELGERVERLADRLWSERANVLLVGAGGVGKSTLLNEVMLTLSKRDSQASRPRTFWRSDPHRLIADAKYLGEWQALCEHLVERLETVNGLLWLLDITQLLKLGGEGTEDSVAAFLMPFIRQGRLQLVGEITPKGLVALRNKMPGFVEYFQIEHLSEMSDKQTLNVLRYLQEYSARQLDISIDNDALQLTLRFCKRYLKYSRLPGNAVNFLHDCIQHAWREENKRINLQAVADRCIQKTGLPAFILDDQQALRIDKVSAFFHRRLIGQTQAIDYLIRVINVFKAGLNDPNKPIATLMFAGPTGVGKTAAAKLLAQFFFGAGQATDPLYRLDMSEFQHPSQIARLIGEVGGQPGPLIQHVRNRPFSIILFDEIEKAHASIFDALMTVFDEGLLTDAFGRETDFRNTILVMTTNLGAGQSRPIGFAPTGQEQAQTTQGIRKFFRPEFFNRIDQVLHFHALSAAHVRQIAEIELLALNQREGFVSRNLTLDFTPALIEQVAQAGFHPDYGARPLQRAIEQQVVAPLARALLAHADWRDRTIRVDWAQTLQIDT